MPGVQADTTTRLSGSHFSFNVGRCIDSEFVGCMQSVQLHGSMYQGLWTCFSCELPLCHRQARASESGHTAQHNHAEYPARASCQPEADLLACAVAQPCCLSRSPCQLVPLHQRKQSQLSTLAAEEAIGQHWLQARVKCNCTHRCCCCCCACSSW